MAEANDIERDEGPKRRPAIPSREEQAKAEIGVTDVSPAVSWVLVSVFLTVVFAVPLVQWGVDASRGDGVLPKAADILRRLPAAKNAYASHEGGALGKTLSANADLLRNINDYEDELEEGSLLTDKLLGPAQALMAGLLGQGNEDGYLGRDGWLFYRPALDYLTGPGFLDARHQRKQATSGNEYTEPPQPDPRLAILEFHRQLKERGITLVVVPAPAKAAIHPERFTSRYGPDSPLIANPSYEAFVEEISEAGVLVFDPAPLLEESHDATGEVQFLEADTHWTPETMDRAAFRLAEFVEERIDLEPASKEYRRDAVEVSNLGDVAAMLQLPEGQTLYEEQATTVQQVTESNGSPWRPSRDAEVLVLGDSYSNIFSLGEMGWGESAGLVEQLSFHLKRPVDRIVQNDSGAYATRQTLSRELAKGRDRLAGKKVVVWEFGARELSVGDWKLLDLSLGEAAPARFVVPRTDSELVVEAVVVNASSAPRPGTVPYKDHIVSVHLRDLETADGPIEGGEALVYMRSMRNNVWTKAARLRMGQAIRVRLRNWNDVASKYGTINRTELDDDDLLLEDPCWGEWLREPVRNEK